MDPDPISELSKKRRRRRRRRSYNEVTSEFACIQGP